MIRFTDLELRYSAPKGAQFGLGVSNLFDVYPRAIVPANNSTGVLGYPYFSPFGFTVGGYLTDLMSWHWLFLVNVVPGILVTVSTAILVDFDKPNLSLLDKFDWFEPVLRSEAGAVRRQDGHPQAARDRLHRPERLRQVDPAAHLQPHERPGRWFFLSCVGHGYAGVWHNYVGACLILFA
ncbi:hypothetical protein [Mangrovicoccus ximenensis]